MVKVLPTMDKMEDWEKWAEDTKSSRILGIHFETKGQSITLIVERDGQKSRFRYFITYAGQIQDLRTNDTLIGAVLEGVRMAFSEYNAVSILQITHDREEKE